MSSIDERAARVRLVVLDVDGVLTDGGLIYADDGAESKRFHTQDGLGLTLLRKAGVRLAMVSGRASAAVERRAVELGFDHVILGVRGDKWPHVEAIMSAEGVRADAVAYMGDDLPDLPALQRVGFACAPADAATDILTRVHWISRRPGGHGAVRELAECVLKSQGRWQALVSAYAGSPDRAESAS